MNKVNPFRALTTPLPLIFLSNLSNTDEVALVANLGKTCLAKGTARSNNAFFVEITHHIRPTLIVIHAHRK